MQNSFSTQPALFHYAADFDHKALHELDGVEEVLNWQILEDMMSSLIYASETGAPSYPILTLFRARLLGIWYKLSAGPLSACLARDLLFRRFCHLEFDGGVPCRRTLERFLDQLTLQDLWEPLLGEVNRQLEEQHIIITAGRINIIDATPIEAARSGLGKSKGKETKGEPTQDPEAGKHVKQNSRGKVTATFGYSVHTAVDEDGFIHRQTVTAGNAHDSTQIDVLLLGDETALYADSAYSSQETRDKLELFGIDDQVQRKGYRNNPISEADLLRNAEIAVIRAGGERPFAVYKKDFGLARTRYLGLAKNMSFFGLAAIAANLKKAAKFLRLYGLRSA